MRGKTIGLSFDPSVVAFGPKANMSANTGECCARIEPYTVNKMFSTCVMEVKRYRGDNKIDDNARGKLYFLCQIRNPGALMVQQLHGRAPS